jgi:hypothetical protein
LVKPGARLPLLGRHKLRNRHRSLSRGQRGLTLGRYPFPHELLVHADVVLGHARRGKALFEGTAAQPPVKPAEHLDRCNRLIEALHQGAVHARLDQLGHGTLVFQLCRPVWQRWIRDAVLSGALDIRGFASEPARYLAVKWIPPKWDWVDPLKDRKAEIEAIDAGLKSRSDVIESEGYDAEEVDRRIAADHAREEELGLKFGRPATAQAEQAVEVDPENRDGPTESEENAA